MLASFSQVPGLPHDPGVRRRGHAGDGAGCLASQSVLGSPPAGPYRGDTLPAPGQQQGRTQRQGQRLGLGKLCVPPQTWREPWWSPALPPSSGAASCAASSLSASCFPFRCHPQPLRSQSAGTRPGCDARQPQQARPHSSPQLPAAPHSSPQPGPQVPIPAASMSGSRDLLKHRDTQPQGCSLPPSLCFQLKATRTQQLQGPRQPHSRFP